MSKSSSKSVSIALVAIGVGLTIWGYQKTQGFNSQVSHVFTGSYSDHTMMLYISGIACVVVGVYLYFKK